MQQHALFRLFTAICLILWGIVLLSPDNNFATSQSFAEMRSWFPSQVWGLFMLGIGITKLTSLSRNAEYAIDLIGLGIWILILMMLLLVKWNTTGTAVYGSIVLCESYRLIFLRTGG